MSNELVRVEQIVDPTAVVVDDDVIEGAAETEPHFTEGVDLILISDGAGGGDILSVRIPIDIDIEILNTDQRVGVDGGKADAETVIRQCDNEPSTVARLIVDAIDFIDDEFMAFGVLLDDTRDADKVEEIDGGAVHDGRLFVIEFDDAVIDLMSVDSA